MKRILLFSLIILFTFIGCTKAEPELESSTHYSTVEGTSGLYSEPETSETNITSAVQESEQAHSSTVTNKTTANVTTKTASTTESKSTTVEAVTHLTTQATVSSSSTTISTTVSTTVAKTTAPVQTTASSSGLDSFKPAVTAKTTVPQITVTVVCSCKNAVDYGIREENPLIPENGIILNTSVTLKQGSTAMDAIKAACEQNSVEIKENRGYISSIGTLAEKDCGGASGWLYSVNGSFPNTSSDKYTLNANDRIELHYTVKNGDVTRM